MKKHMFQLISLCVAVCLLFSLCACGASSATSGTDTAGQTTGTDSDFSVTELSRDALFTDQDLEIGYDEAECISIQLTGSSAQCDSDAVQIVGSTVTITEEGAYLLSGTLENGMVIVDAENTDKIQLVLNGVSVKSASSAALYVRQADKVFLTLAVDTENTLANGGTFSAIDENSIDAAIFSKDDLTLNGTGRLIVNSPGGHGVVSKDDLAITGGTYTVTAANHGLSANDSIRIANGAFTITSGKDAIQAEHTEDTSLGFVYIADGTFRLTASGDGISASGCMQVDGGTFTVQTGGGSEAAPQTSQAAFPGSLGNTATAASDVNTGSTCETTSTKGLKAAGDLILHDGTFQINAADDATHTNANALVSGGRYQISTGDDGFHANEHIVITDGDIQITTSYEGIEGQQITISGGTINVTARDDGLNAAGGNDQSGASTPWGGSDPFAVDADAYIRISGGTLRINAAGDGIDSNGSLYVSGGETMVSCPVNNGNGALDYNGEASITGGVFLAAGSAQMALNFGSGSTQGSILISTGAQSAGSTVQLTDSSGKTLVSWQVEKAYDSVIISCPEIVQGASYTVTAGTYTSQLTMDDLIYGAGSGMGFGMGGGFGGGSAADGNGPAFTEDGSGTGGMPNGMTPPDGTGTPPPGIEGNPGGHGGARRQPGASSNGTEPSVNSAGPETSAQPA